MWWIYVLIAVGYLCVATVRSAVFDNKMVGNNKVWKYFYAFLPIVSEVVFFLAIVIYAMFEKIEKLF